MGDAAGVANGLSALSVGAKDAAALVGVSVRTWWRLEAAGRTPLGSKVGGRRLWRMADLRAWVDLGFPRREEFDARIRAAPTN